jgi:hypothetical protein
MLGIFESLTEALPWFLRWNGAPYLHEKLAEWGAAQGLIRGDDWTRLFLELYKWIAMLAAAWGIGVGLVVTKRSARGRFQGDPEKYRDAVVKGLLHGAAVAAGGALLVLALFLLAAMGPAPVIWAGVAFLAYRGARFAAARGRRAPAAADRARRRRKPEPA